MKSIHEISAKMSKLGLVVLTILSFSFQNVAWSNETNTPVAVEFFDGDFDSAKTKAGSEGKLFFLDFYADWCLPCKWMDQTTFSDSRIASLMNSSYVAVKMNIDQVEGFELKNKFDIQYLPTILIFNSKGKLIDRLEETMPANRLLAVLESHNNQANKVTITYSTNTSPSKQNTAPSKVTKQFEANKDLLEGYASDNANRIFRLQMGVFDDYENAFTLVNALKEEFIDPIIVLNDYKDGSVRYKIMMGEFSTQDEAEGYRKIVSRDFSRESIVQ
jgi:thioredoxin-related protein